MPESISSGDKYLSVLSPSDKTFDKHKSAAQEIARLYSFEADGFAGFVSGKKLVFFDRYAARIEVCGSWLLFVKDESEKMKLVEAMFCKAPNCPMCQWRRALKWRAKFLTLLPEVKQEYSSHKFCFLTLTKRNCDINTLRDNLKHLNGAFSRLVDRRNFPMDGLVKSVEVTRAWDCYHHETYLGRHGTKWIMQWEYKHKAKLEVKPTDEVHPHLHILGLVPASYFTHGYITQEQWTQMWQESLRVDYKPIIHIKTVKPKKNQRLLVQPEEFEADCNADESGMIAAICETLKYTVKEQDLLGTYCQDDEANAAWLKEMTQQLYKMRRVEYRGVFKEIGKQLDEAEKDGNLINITDEKEEISGNYLELQFL